ncbi:hypothetical protein H4R34_000883 [Dimargaris verticillata]|uniref:High-temperature-induced dauer-formation protein-domain-containing protein n=1 Tax=Dimargaris verticillata TaxID=2761393 RepID=A0A9W8EEA3_9FUNG|nr:hypothetical protein H4R34_000883 [Dimargaris verticillata]
MGTTDSKIAFRKGIFRLSQERNLASIDEYWTSLWTVPDSADDIFSLFTTQDMRRIRDQAPENFTTLLHKVFDHMVQLKESPVLAHPAATASEAAPITPQAVQATTKQLLNCIRLLTRLIPFIYEAPSTPDGATNVATNPLLWSSPNESVKLFGDRLLAQILDLLFLAGFTVPHPEGDTTARINYCIWESGIGQTQTVSTTKDLIFHRLEVVRLLLSLLSEPMYTPAHSILATRHPAVEHIAYYSDKKVVLTLLCSLLNTAMKYKSSGWGIPYKMKPTHDPHDLLAVHSLQILLVLLKCPENRTPGSAQGTLASVTDAKSPLPSEPGSPTSPTPQEPLARTARSLVDTPTEQSEKSLPGTMPTSPHSHSRKLNTAGAGVGLKNMFCGCIARLHRPGDFAFLASNISRILAAVMRTRASYFKLGTRPHHTVCQEVTMFLWSLLQTNLRFGAFLIESEEFLPLVTAIAFFAWDGKQDPLAVGQVRMSTFLLHLFSAEPRFSERLNASFDQSVLPTAMRIPNQQVTYADWIIYLCYTLITTTKKLHVALYPTLLIILSNMAPHLKHLSSLASEKVMRLCAIFAAPSMLLANDHHYRLLAYALETVDYVIHYQLQDNKHFLYALIRANATFEQLRDLDFDQALAQQQAARQSRDNAVTNLSDKAQGKRPESSPNPSATPTAGEEAATVPPGSSGEAGEFQPTRAWFKSWYNKLPLSPLLQVLTATVPFVDEYLEVNALQSDTQMLAFLRSTEFQERLPALDNTQTPIVIRHMRWSKPLSAWYVGLLWSQIYVSGLSPLGLWNGTAIQLFQVKSQ